MINVWKQSWVNAKYIRDGVISLKLIAELIMDYDYDEVIMENVFYQALVQNYRDLFQKCVTEGCILCVPRAGSVSKFMLTLEDFCAHILVPSCELPESHFLNVNGEEVRICNGIVSVEHEVGHQSTVHILFEETFYTNDDLKYKVLCLEKPIESKNIASSDTSRITVLKTLKECMDFLWLESGSSNVSEKINQLTSEFLKANHSFDGYDLQTIIDITNLLYANCIQAVLKYPKIRERVESDKTLVPNLKVAVETCMQQNIYNKVIKGISACTASEDACLNKILRNISHLQIQDLDIRPELYDAIPIAKFELCKIDGYSTVLGKSGCLKKMLLTLSNYSNNQKVVAADDVLQILIFLIIKIGLSNWNAQLKYLKFFRFSAYPHVQDEICFLITTFEAALQHIQSEMMVDGCNFMVKNYEASDDTVKYLPTQYRDEGPDFLHNLFKSISLGNLEEVKLFIDRDRTVGNDSYLHFCHPLCLCSKCKALISRSKDNFVTVNSCDRKGLTPLHIASMYHKSSIVEFLLANGADPNKCDFNGLSAMHYAAMKGHQNGLLLVAYAGGDVNSLDFSLNTPLHYCANNGHENCVKALIYFCENSGIKLNINAQNSCGDTPLHKASRWGYVNIVNLLSEHGADPAIRNKKKLSPIDVAHNSKILELLTRPCEKVQNYVRIIPFRPMLDHQEEQSDSSSKQTVKGVVPGSVDQLKKLEKILRAIADGDSHLACFYLGLDVSELEKETTLESREETLDRKCHPLCRCSHCEASSSDDNQEIQTKSYKTDRMNINSCNAEGYTPLHMTAIHGRVELCNLLIQNGAVLNVQTRTGLFTPLMLACQHRRLETVKLLLKSGCNIDMQDDQGNTALHHASRTGDTKIVSTLVEYDPDVSLKNHRNKTVLQEAKEKMFIGVIKAIKKDSVRDELVNHFADNNGK